MLNWKAIVAVSGLLVAAYAHADVVTFENQPAGPGLFATAGPAQTLVYNFGSVTATFSGGVILTNETSQTTDFTNVYATSSFGDPTLTNPLTVTFSQPIQNFQIQILNALAGPYTIADNVGDSLNFNLATTGGSIQTEGFAAAGTQVTITSDATGEFDFAIDNVTFDQPLGAINPTPEPGTLLTLGSGLFGVLGLRFRKWTASKSL